MWRYFPQNRKPARTRWAPEVEGPRSDHTLVHGDLFRAVEEQRGSDGVLFLKLEGNKGWIFDQKPGFGTMCVRQADEQKHEHGPSEEVAVVDDVPRAVEEYSDEVYQVRLDDYLAVVEAERRRCDCSQASRGGTWAAKLFHDDSEDEHGGQVNQATLDDYLATMKAGQRGDHQLECERAPRCWQLAEV